jgi:hypothetical protein
VVAPDLALFLPFLDALYKVLVMMKYNSFKGYSSPLPTPFVLSPLILVRVSILTIIGT